MGWVRGRRSEIRRLKQRLLGDDVVSIKQEGGAVAHFDAREVFVDTFKYFSDSLMADADREPRPEPPEVLRAVAGAEDRRAAYEKVMGGATHLPVEVEALLERGEFVPRSMVAGYETYEEFITSGGVPDLSEK